MLIEFEAVLPQDYCQGIEWLGEKDYWLDFGWVLRQGYWLDFGLLVKGNWLESGPLPQANWIATPQPAKTRTIAFAFPRRRITFGQKPILGERVSQGRQPPDEVVTYPTIIL